MVKLPPLSLYIHIPWCVQKCPYCDFNSHALKGEVPHDDYVQHLLNDLDNDVANAQRIIICNDEVYNDEVRRTLLRQAAPPGMKVNVVNIEKAVAVYHNPQYQDETVFYLFTRPQDALAMVRQGVKIDTLNIGGMAWRPGKKQLTKAVSLDDDDINAFHELNNLGVILDLRVVASDPSINIIDKINEQLIAN